MEYALAVLLATSLTCAGLLAAWAATSPQHWFLRAGAFVGVLSLLLLIPAYEPFVAFVLQGAVVAAGVWLVRFRKNRLAETPPTGRRFSLATLLLTMVFVAIAAAVGSRLPAINLRAWQSVLLIGLTGGLATLLGLWVVVGRRGSWWLRGVMGIVLAICISLPLMLCDWFVASMVYSCGWPPPEPSTVTLLNIFAGKEYQESNLITLWMTIDVAAFVAMSGILLLSVWLIATRKSAGQNSQVKRSLVSGLLIIFVFAVAIPPAVVYYRLMTPLPIPVVELPDPNGYHDFVAAGEIAMKGKIEISGGDYETATLKQLTAAMLELQPAFELLSLGLAKETLAPMDYTSFAYMYGIQSNRSLIRAVEGRGRLAELENRIEDAANDYSEAMQFGCAIRRNGMMVDALVGIACSGIGMHSLYDICDKISSQQCAELIPMLLELEQQLEPADEAVYRDRIWAQHAMGWHNHLAQILNDVFGDGKSDSQEGYYIACNRDLTAMRLLRLELTLRLWSETRGSLPQTLEELVPEYLPAVPVDPYDPAGGLMRYRRTEEGYVLYSVGRNGVDEGGVKPAEAYDFSTADLSLDVLYADETVEEETGSEDEVSETYEVP